MLPCLRLLRVVSLICAAVTVCGLAQAQQPAKPPAAPAPAQKPPQAAAPQAKDPGGATVNGQTIYQSEIEVAQAALTTQHRTVPQQSVHPALLVRLNNSKLVVPDAKNNKAVGEALKDPKLGARIAEVGGLPKPMTPAEFGKLVADETEKWRKVVEFASVSVD